LEKIRKDFESCFQKMGVVRYNPFGEIGGDQSFSLVIMDKNDKGVVVTSIHSREGTRTYAKPIKSKKSEYHLSEEESKAIELAQKRSEKILK